MKTSEEIQFYGEKYAVASLWVAFIAIAGIIINFFFGNVSGTLICLILSFTTFLKYIEAKRSVALSFESTRLVVAFPAAVIPYKNIIGLLHSSEKKLLLKIQVSKGLSRDITLSLNMFPMKVVNQITDILEQRTGLKIENLSAKII